MNRRNGEWKLEGGRVDGDEIGWTREGAVVAGTELGRIWDEVREDVRYKREEEWIDEVRAEDGRSKGKGMKQGRRRDKGRGGNQE